MGGNEDKLKIVIMPMACIILAICTIIASVSSHLYVEEPEKRTLKIHSKYLWGGEDKVGNIGLVDFLDLSEALIINLYANGVRNLTEEEKGILSKELINELEDRGVATTGDIKDMAKQFEDKNDRGTGGNTERNGENLEVKEKQKVRVDILGERYGYRMHQPDNVRRILYDVGISIGTEVKRMFIELEIDDGLGVISNINVY